MTIHKLMLTVLLAIGAGGVVAQSDSARYVKTQQGFFMVLRQGDNVVEHLEKLMVDEKIPAATISGMGFMNARFGFYKQRRGKFKDKHFRKMEMASIQGSLAWENNRPSVHLHGVGAGRNFKAIGGHLLGATVSTGTAEINITVINHQLERRTDPALGVPVLKLE